MSAPNDNTSEREKSFFEKMEIMRTLCYFPALTLMVFIRRKVGYRTMKTSGLIVMAIIMMIYASLAHSYSHESSAPLTIFALVMLGAAIVQRSLRWRELCQGVRWHTYSVGISYFELVPWPPVLSFMRGYRRIYRFLDPLACVIVGLIVMSLSTSLGIWIVFSSIALRIFEEDLFEKALARDLDILDGLISSEIQVESVKHFDGPQPDQKALALEDTAGIPTGVAPDIHKQVSIRKAKLVKAPDNLVAETKEWTQSTQRPNGRLRIDAADLLWLAV